MAFRNRRVVTGIDASGKSCVISDARLDEIAACGGDPTIIWKTDDYPVSNAGHAEGAQPFGTDSFNCSSFFLMFTQEPGKPSAWHATDTVDYVIVLSGRVMLELEAGGVELGPGDLIVDRGVTHSWRAIGDEPAVIVASVVRANPVGKGAHFSADFDHYLKD